jgi:SAM-dependent methyltransferase
MDVSRGHPGGFGMDNEKSNGNNESDQSGAKVCEGDVQSRDDQPSMGIRLNLGCGNKILAGYINCDLSGNYSDINPDVSCDIRKLPFNDDYADEVLAVHVLEHFYVWEVEDILNEWIRVLKPGGKLIVELPSLDKIINSFIRFDGRPPINIGMWGLYGEPRYKDEKMCHRWCYSESSLAALLQTVGLTKIKSMIPKFHVAIRDMRMEAIK